MNLKKRLLSLGVAAAIAVTSVASFAAGGGEMLYKYKFITGTSDQKMELKEELPLTREQLAILITELQGEKAEALKQAGVPTYSDTVSIASWAQAYVAYCESKQWMKGIGSNLFDGKGRVTGRQLALVLLRAMGYTVEWDEVDATIQKLGIPIENKPLTRGEAFDYIWTAITKPISADGIVLGVKLGKLSEEQATTLAYPKVDLKLQKKDGKYGYVDSKGNVVIPHQFDEAREFIGEVAIVTDGKTALNGLIDKTGKLIYGYDLRDTVDYENGFIMISKGWVAALIDYSGKQRIPFSAKYQMLTYLKKDKLVAAVDANGTKGLVTTDNEVVIPFEYGSMFIPSGSDGYITVANKDDMKYGAINLKNEVVIPFEYEELDYFVDGASVAKKNGKYGIIDKDNKVILPFAYENIYGDYDDKYLEFRVGDTIGLMDKTGKVLIPAKWYTALKYLEQEDRVIADNGPLSGLLTVNGEELAPVIYDRLDDTTRMIKIHRKNGTVDEVRVFLVEKDGKRGCMDLDGKLVVPLLPDGWDEEYYERDF